MKRFGLFLLGLLSSIPAFSQANFQAGFYVNFNGDTVSGYINYEDRRVTPEVFEFKTGPDQGITRLKPQMVREVRTGNVQYISGIVNLEISSTNVETLERGAELNYITDTVFLYTLVRGEKCLYENISSKGRANYYILRDNQLDLLVYKEYLKDRASDDGRGSVMVKAINRQYQGQLYNYLQECKGIAGEIKKVTYSRKSLLGLFSYYYENVDSEKFYASGDSFNEHSFGLSAGMNVTTLRFISPFFPELVDADMTASLGYSLGGSFEIIIPEYLQHFSVYTEVGVTSFHLTGHYEEYHSEVYYNLYDTEFSYIYLTANTMFRYRYYLDKISLYANLGLNMNFSLKSYNHYDAYNVFFSDIKEYSGEALEYTKIYEVGLAAGGGIDYGKYFLDLRYTLSNGMSSYAYLNAWISRYQLMVGFRF